jgi:hypothetical protein
MRKAHIKNPETLPQDYLPAGCVLFTENKNIKIIFNSIHQIYNVYKDNKLLVENLYRFTDAKPYLN